MVEKGERAEEVSGKPVETGLRDLTEFRSYIEAVGSGNRAGIEEARRELIKLGIDRSSEAVRKRRRSKFLHQRAMAAGEEDSHKYENFDRALRREQEYEGGKRKDSLR